MKKIILFLGLLTTCFGKPAVTTTLAPYAYAIKKIVNSTCDVHILIPENANPHIYETRPQDISQLVHSSLWFCSGEAMEKKISVDLKAKRVDLNHNINLIHTHHHHHDHQSCCQDQDLHTWMSPGNYLKQTKTIFEALCLEFPEHKALFTKNYLQLEKELIELTAQIQSAPKTVKSLLVSHAAYAYLCQDLGISQLSIEEDGKESSLKHIQSLYQTQKEQKPKAIFAQKQHSDLGAKRLALLLNTPVVMVNPYQENYPQAVLEILHQMP